jgi:hypothetical protein
MLRARVAPAAQGQEARDALRPQEWLQSCQPAPLDLDPGGAVRQPEAALAPTSAVLPIFLDTREVAGDGDGANPQAPGVPVAKTSVPGTTPRFLGGARRRIAGAGKDIATDTPGVTGLESAPQRHLSSDESGSVAVKPRSDDGVLPLIALGGRLAAASRQDGDQASQARRSNRRQFPSLPNPYWVAPRVREAASMAVPGSRCCCLTSPLLRRLTQGHQREIASGRIRLVDQLHVGVRALNGLGDVGVSWADPSVVERTAGRLRELAAALSDPDREDALIRLGRPDEGLRLGAEVDGVAVEIGSDLLVGRSVPAGNTGGERRLRVVSITARENAETKNGDKRVVLDTEGPAAVHWGQHRRPAGLVQLKPACESGRAA